MKTFQTILVVIIVMAASILNLACGPQKIPQQQTAAKEEKILTDTAKPQTQKAKPQTQKTETKSKQQPKKQPKKQPQKQKGTPVITVEKPVHNFGKVVPATKNKCVFEFKNTGDGVLKIDRIQSNCACTTPKLPKKNGKQSKTFDPGESGTIEVIYKVPTRPGPTQQTITIHSNDKKNPRLKLTMKATVVLQVEITPAEMELSLMKENAGASPVTITSKDGKPFSIKNILSANKAITADFDPLVKDTKFVINPVVDMKRLKARPNGSITFTLTHPGGKQVFVKYHAPPLYKMSQSKIFLQQTEPGQTVTKDITISANYGGDVEIDSITSAKNYIEILSNKKVGKTVKLKIKITPPPKTGKLRFFKDDLKIVLKDKEKLVIYCTGTYKTKPRTPRAPRKPTKKQKPQPVY